MKTIFFTHDKLLKVGRSFIIDYYEKKIGFVAIKCGCETAKCETEYVVVGTVLGRRYKCECSGKYIPNKSSDSIQNRERSSKKIDCPFRINVGYRPVTKEIVIRNNNNNK